MKKSIFFLLLIANYAMAQTDSTVVSTDTLSKHKTVLVEDVVITSTRAGSNSPTAYQNLSKEELRKNNLGQDLPILLDNTASVVTTSDAGAGVGYTGIRIRGSDNTRINVTFNGIPVNDAESQGMFWVNLPDIVSSTQNIQIQRGVGTSTNGPGAFGGTISLQSQSASPNPYGEAAISGGSFGTLKMTGKAGTGLIKNRFFAEGSASWIRSNGYIDRARSNLQSYFAQLGYINNGTLLKFVYFGGRERTYQAWNGVPQDSLKTNRTFNNLGTDFGAHEPAYNNQVDNYGQDYFQLLFAQQLPQNLNLNLGLFATLGRGYYEEYKAGADINSYFPNYDSVGTATDLVRQKWLRNIFYGGTFSLTYAKKNITATLGGLLGQYRGDHFGKVIWAEQFPLIDKDKHYYDGKSIKNDFNVYAKFNYELKEIVDFYIDVQYRYVNHNINGIDNNLAAYAANNTWHFFNPKVGILAKVKPQHHVYASFAIGNREPNRDDVMASTASKKAKSETLYDVEAGYKFLNGKFPLSANFYYMHYKDQLVLTGRLNDVGNPIKENVPVSYRTGIELNGSFNFYKTKLGKYKGEIVDNLQRDAMLKEGIIERRKVFAINYSFTYSLNKIKSFDEYVYTYDENYSPIDTLTLVTSHKNSNITFSPSIIASLELVAYPIKGLSISLTTKAVSKQYLDNTSNENRKIKPFTYSNLNITYQLPLKATNKEVRLTLLLNNIFNRLYESNGYTYSERYNYDDGTGNRVNDGPYTYNYYYPQAGFNMLGGINVRF